MVCEYLSKGSSVLIEGRLKFETWEKEGQKHSKLKVIGEKMQMLGGRGGGGGGGGGGGSQQATSSQSSDFQQQSSDFQQQPAATGAASEPSGDDIPF